MDLTEIWQSFVPIIFTPTLTNFSLGQGHVTSQSYEIIHEVMFGQNQEIWGATVAVRVSSLSSTWADLDRSIGGSPSNFLI